MQRLFYILFLVIAYPLSMLPMRALYLFSDIVFLACYYFPGYRKAIVMRNLRNAFPGRRPAELCGTARRFYRLFCDVMAEYLKLLTASRKTVRKMCRITNAGLLEKYHIEKRSMVGVLAHYGNWELCVLGIAQYALQPVMSVYLPPDHPHFDRLLYRIRTRLGARMIEMEKIARAVLHMKGEHGIVMLAADQSPLRADTCLWTNFLNQETPVYQGVEKIALKTGFPVVFCKMQRERRGHYVVELIPVCENPSRTKEGEITLLHTRFLEKTIRESPEYWLWSHRRWKRSRPPQAPLTV